MMGNHFTSIALSDPALISLAQSFFDATLNSTHGAVEITTNNAFRCRSLLYRYRAELEQSNPYYSLIDIHISPDNPEMDLWLEAITMEEKLKREERKQTRSNSSNLSAISQQLANLI